MLLPLPLHYIQPRSHAVGFSEFSIRYTSEQIAYKLSRVGDWLYMARSDNFLTESIANFGATKKKRIVCHSEKCILVAKLSQVKI